jgi:broad specificity phosphatase PhoE
MKRIFIPNPLKIQSRIINQVSCLKNDLKSNLFIIRHAESHFNKAIFEIKNGIEKKNISLEEYEKKNKEIRFGVDFCDSPLTDYGRSQCLLASNLLKTLDIKYVFVSPMLRTLMTLESVLESVNKELPVKIKPKVIVHPLIFEKIEDSCDLIFDLNKNKKDYSFYDWSHFEEVEHPSAYQLNYCDEGQLNYFKLAIENFEKNKKYDHHEIILKEMEKLSTEKKFIESSSSTIDRLRKFNEFLNLFIVNIQVGPYQKILIVGHSVLFRHLIATNIDKITKLPEESQTLKNCQIANIKCENFVY